MYKIPRHTSEYLTELGDFMKVAEADRVNKENEKISCPCKKCQNFASYVDRDVITRHLIVYGFVEEYTCWSWHGELLVDSNPIVGEYNDDDHDATNVAVDEKFESDSDGYIDNLEDMLHDVDGNIDENNYDKFQQMFVDSEKILYSGCTKFTKLSAVLRLLNLKTNNGWSDKSFTELLKLLHEMLPDDNELPVSLYQAMKIMCPMGLEVERIHACPNDCMLYRNEYKDLHKCRVCGTSRYKSKDATKEVSSDVNKNGPPAKVLWYLPLIPRLKRLFANAKDARLLRWHAE
ncbi:uncharacterized protein [Rutidosis leptorrhynchoides]|uniref:uncharacterized protein n=1 Tax=Rutidosis leptorrhynchoides TaxID=125765 RepID=UPI003A991E01